MARVPAGAASSRSRRLPAKTRTASSSAACRSRIRKSMSRWTRIRVRHAQRTVSGSHWSAGRPASAMPNVRGDRALVRRRAGRGRRRSSGLEREGEDVLLLAAEHREDAVRGQPGERLGEVEVVGELRARRPPCRRAPGEQPAPRPQPLAQLADQVGVLGELLDEDRAGALERGGGVGDAPSASTKPAAAARRVRVGSPSSPSASGSSPASRAICAFVRRFGLYGR